MNLASFSYTEILQRLAQADKSGLDALYRQYGRQFYGYAVSKWQFDEDAAWEMVYQTLETFVLKHEKYTFTSQSEFDRFLFKTFLNFLRQRYRHDARHPAFEGLNENEASPDEDEADGNDFDTEFEDKDSPTQPQVDVLASGEEIFGTEQEAWEQPALTRLKNALDRLSPTERDLLLLRAQNFSYEEIARFLGVENNQLKVQHVRAKQKLIRLYNQEP